LRRVAALATYLAVSFGVAYAIDFLALIKAIELHRELEVLYLGVARMYAPFLGAVCAAIVSRAGLGTLRRWGLRLGRARWIPLGIALPYTFYALAIPLAMAVGITVTNPIYSIPKLEYMLTKIPNPSLILALALVNTVIAGCTINTAAAIGEEMGWRGYMLTTLSPKLGLYGAAVAIGIVWSLWHAPLILLAGFNYPHHPNLEGLAAFTGFCVALSVACSVLRAKSTTPSVPTRKPERSWRNSATDFRRRRDLHLSSWAPRNSLCIHRSHSSSNSNQMQRPRRSRALATPTRGT